MFAFRLNFDESDVVALVGSDELRGIARLIAEDDFDGLRFLHDVKIRQDVAFIVDHEAGAGAFDGNGIHEEIVFGGFGEDVGDGRRNLAIDADVDGFLVGKSGVARGYVGYGDIFCGAGIGLQGGNANWLALAPTASGPVGGGDDYQAG